MFLPQIQVTTPNPIVSMCRYDEKHSGQCDPMVVPAIATHIPAHYGSNTCTETCDFTIPEHWEYSCTDRRRVLVTTERGEHLCILFPDPVK